MTKSFHETIREARRLALLQLLAQAPRYEAAAEVLYAALPARGLSASADAVNGDLAWLTEQGLADTSTIGGVTLARITQRGLEVAQGVVTVPGVKAPLP